MTVSGIAIKGMRSGARRGKVVHPIGPRNIGVSMSKRLVDVLLINADDGGRTAIADETREDVDLKRRLVPLTSDGHILVGWDSDFRRVKRS